MEVASSLQSIMPAGLEGGRGKIDDGAPYSGCSTRIVIKNVLELISISARKKCNMFEGSILMTF